MCQFCFSVSCNSFVFVLFCRAFSKAVFHSNFGFSGFVFLSLWGFLSLLSAFLGACTKAFLHLLLFNVILPFFMFLVASFSSGCFFYLFSLGHHMAPFCLLCATYSFVCFCFFVFCWAVFHPALSLLVLLSPVCRAWIHSLFSFFS